MTESPATEATDNHNNDTTTTDKKAVSVGEELFLVHLRRDEKTERNVDDLDRENPKKHGRIGEELWNIHLKRSRGLKEDEEKQSDRHDKVQNTISTTNKNNNKDENEKTPKQEAE